MYTQPTPTQAFIRSPHSTLSHKGVNGNFYFGEENEAKKRDLLKRDKNFSKQWKGNFKMFSRKKKTLTFEGFRWGRVAEKRGCTRKVLAHVGIAEALEHIVAPDRE